MEEEPLSLAALAGAGCCHIHSRTSLSPRTGRGYWLAYPESRRNVPKIKLFRDWIVGEIGR